MTNSLNNSIITEVTEGNNITSLQTEGQSVQTIVQSVPQIQTIIYTDDSPVTTIVDAPWTMVTSINGMTGDVIVEPLIFGFTPNHYYLKNTVVVNNRKLWSANANFTSESIFNQEDWEWIGESGGVSSYEDLEDKPHIDTTHDTSQTPKNEELVSVLNLHKISKTGNWSDILNKPSGLVIDINYVHTENNFTTVLKNQITTNQTNITNLTVLTNNNETAIATLEDNINTRLTNTEEAIEDEFIQQDQRLTDLEVFKSQILAITYPVGSIYMSVNNINPGTLFGGNWVAWGQGRVPVGVDTGQTEFDTVEKTGGAKTHNHGLASGSALIGSPSGNANALGFRSTQIGSLADSKYSVGNSPSAAANGHPNRSHNTALDGSTDNGTTLQPYITCYMFKRVS